MFGARDMITRNAGSVMLSCSIHAVLIVLCMKMNWITSVHSGHDKTTPIIIIPQQQPETSFTFEKPSLQQHEEFRMQAIGRPDDTPPGYKDDRLPKIESPYALPVVNFTPDIRLRADVGLSGVATLDTSLLNAPQGTSNAIGGQFYGMGGAGFAGSFGRHMRGVREMGLDVVFIFDATSSMAQFLRQVKTKIASLAMTFKVLVPTARIGLVAYRDRTDDFVTKSVPLTHKTQQLEQFLQGIDPVGGGDHAEAVTEGLRVAINDFNWGKNSKKIIMVIGDAPPHQEDIQQAKELVEKFKTSMGGMVATLDTSGQGLQVAGQAPSRLVIPEFREIALIGGGESARMVDEEKVIKQMVVLVFGTKWESYLDEFLKNL